MFNKTFKTLAYALIGIMLTTSCIGSFKLFNNVREWNQELTDSKFVNELVFFLLNIVPVYEVCALVDVLVLNSVEFWTGDNPVASNVGKTQNVMGSDGNVYAVTNLKDGYEIKNPKGEIVEFTYDKKQKTWSMETPDGQKVKLLRIKDKETAEIFLPGGRTQEVSMDRQGLYEARMAVGNGYFFALQ